jgi:hypothetical protein
MKCNDTADTTQHKETLYLDHLVCKSIILQILYILFLNIKFDDDDMLSQSKK